MEVAQEKENVPIVKTTLTLHEACTKVREKAEVKAREKAKTKVSPRDKAKASTMPHLLSLIKRPDLKRKP